MKWKIETNMKRFFYCGALILGMIAQTALAQISYTGRHSQGEASSFQIELSADESKLIKIVVTALPCGSDSPFGRHSFTLDLNPGISITGDHRFSSRALAVVINPDPGHSHTLDIDGVLFDADGDGVREQALGGLAFVSGPNRCHFQWWATAVAFDDDGDGWSDTAERRLGSEYRRQTAFGFGVNSTPEHREVPTTSLFGPCPCKDFSDNDNFSDRDGRLDGNEADGLDLGSEPDCAPPLPEPQPVLPAFTGRYAEGNPGSFALELSSDGGTVIKIVASALACGSDVPFGRHTFVVELNPGIAVSNDRFSARAIPVTITPDPGHAHTLDIDGVLFDGDGDGTKEQALGGMSFVSGASRCPFRWWATAIAPDDDGDGWSDSAERRLGSEYRRQTAFGFGISSTPEHRDVPTTSLSGPDVCHDFADNDNFSDRDSRLDGQETDGPDSDPCPDCAGALAAPSELRTTPVSRTQINLEWRDNSANETGFEIERRQDNQAFAKITETAANVTAYADTGLSPTSSYRYRVRAFDMSSNACTFSNYSNETANVITAVNDRDAQMPLEYELSQNFPNPFNPSTTIDYALPRADHVQLTILNLIGKEVAILVNEKKSAGRHRAHWNAPGLASGVYLYLLQAGEFVETKKMILMR